MSVARPLEGKRVLVVEDDFLIAAAACKAMRDAGAAAVVPVASPSAAIEIATHEKLDGVILDVVIHDDPPATCRWLTDNETKVDVLNNKAIAKTIIALLREK